MKLEKDMRNIFMHAILAAAVICLPSLIEMNTMVQSRSRSQVFTI